MPRITVITRSGEERSFETTNGRSVMEAVRDSGVDELLAICGGCLSCATCHVHVDPAFAGKLPPISADESGLLEGSAHLSENSRLSCQLRISDALDGLRITIAPDE